MVFSMPSECEILLSLINVHPPLDRCSTDWNSSSFSGWCDEDGIPYPARIETEEVSEEEFDFELPLVPENRALDRQGLNWSRFRLKMESGGDISKTSSNGTRNESYVAFDIDGGQAIDRRDAGRAAGLNCADRDGVIKPKDQSTVSVADVLKTLFFILVKRTHSVHSLQ